MPRHLVLLALLISAAAAEPPPPAASCGAEGAVCGSSLPPGSPCSSDPGYCRPGLYCARCAGNGGCKDARSLCRPLPKGCGTAAVADARSSWDGNSTTGCCPPNAYRPLTANASVFMPPTCGGGLTCQFFTQGPWRNHPDDPYAANLFERERYGACLAVAPDCGAPGKRCCPNPYHTGYEPQPRGWLCWGGLDYSNATYCDSKTDTCTPNASNCGRAGAPCCVSDGGSSTNYRCGSGQFCATGGAPVALCQQCPADWRQRLDKSSWEYAQCAQ
ncbi:hypothetical protein Rsub_08652 [Raphidocelis subcapitata]|uniref:Uncharacterized protein n=1 Tax=Raphidocelis subcapitata TaxID=307507 RepID=A0A2V0PCQ9_9CHLO|nr:hypothetical protein Rsub_08652 [Raphidocelis subcapitata]|eukprot:GBF95670.1 hypothetical protein Rsub_08652 [Raphidocelis subcapitata]